jgi:thiol:disulfide interchange protein DsbD
MFNRTRNTAFCLLALVVLFFGHAAFAEALPPPADKAFLVAASRADDGLLTLRWTIAPGNYLYRDSLKATLDGRDVPLATRTGDEKDDPNFGRVDVYHDEAEATVAGLPASGHLQIFYRGCAEQGICYPPLAKAIDLKTLAVSDVRQSRDSEARAESSAATSGAAPVVTPSQPSGGEAGAASTYMNGGFGSMLAAFLGFGLLLALTPCVFPMIPILSGILASSGDRLSPTRGFALSLSYVLAMSAAYAVLGLAAGWSGQNLQAALQTPWALGLMAAIFTALALSMFGLFDLQLPTGPATRLAGGRVRGGGVAGAALLGFSSALIVGPCVTPPLAAAMLYAAQTGEAGKGAAALFTLGLGMGLPIVAVGTFGARLLPRSGPWLAQVKRVFGVIFVFVSASLVTRLLPGPAALALWGTVAIGVGVFIGGFDRLRAASGWDARLGKATGLAAAVYGATLIIGFAGGATDPMRPLAFLGSGTAPVTSSASRSEVTSLAALDRALASLAGNGRPVLVSFTARWCTVCKSNEKVLDEPSIRARLEHLPVIAADVSTYGEEAKALLARFSVAGPPTLFLLDAGGQEIPGSRLIGPITADDIARRLAGAGV